MDELDLDLDFQIDNFEEELEDESISSSSGPDSEIDEGEVGDFDDESNAPQAQAASIYEWCYYGRCRYCLPA